MWRSQADCVSFALWRVCMCHQCKPRKAHHLIGQQLTCWPVEPETLREWLNVSAVTKPSVKPVRTCPAWWLREEIWRKQHCTCSNVSIMMTDCKMVCKCEISRESTCVSCLPRSHLRACAHRQKTVHARARLSRLGPISWAQPSSQHPDSQASLRGCEPRSEAANYVEHC